MVDPTIYSILSDEGCGAVVRALDRVAASRASIKSSPDPLPEAHAPPAPRMRRLPGLSLAGATMLRAGDDRAAGTPAAIVAIGDVHGDADAFVALLTRTGLRERGAGNGAAARPRSCRPGDYLDRGAQVRDVLDLLMALEPQAKAAGGRSSRSSATTRR